MSDNQLSRRKVLGALATTGGAGAIVGTGTGALFTDEETLSSGGIRTSTSVAGTVDINVTEGDKDGTAYHVTVPENGENNPAYIWFRTGCPDPIELGCATEIEIREVCGGTTTDVYTGSARDVLNALRDGTRLCSDGAACVNPGEKRRVEIEVTEDPGSEYDGPDGSLEFDLEFYGEQCRYNTGAENPFGDPLDDNCESCVQELSYVAFCAEDADTQPDPEITGVNARNDDGPTSVDWKIDNDVDVDYVVAKTGQGGNNEEYIVYDYSEMSRTHGTAAVGDDDADFLGDENDVDGYDKNGDINSDPGEFAKDALGHTEDFSGGFVKLEEDDGELEVES